MMDGGEWSPLDRYAVMPLVEAGECLQRVRELLSLFARNDNPQRDHAYLYELRAASKKLTRTIEMIQAAERKRSCDRD